MATIVKRGGGVYERSKIADFICPDDGARGRAKRLGKQVKDHMRDNRNELKNLELKNRELKDVEARNSKDLFKLSQFRNVESRVYESSEVENPSKIEDFLYKNQSKQRAELLLEQKRAMRADLEAKMEEARYFADQASFSRKADVRVNETASLAPRKDIDFIRSNKEKARSLPPLNLKTATEEGPYKHAAYGKVPEYLVHRKADWQYEEDAIRRRAPDPSCPPGMRLMPNDERESTLNTLFISKEQALKQLRNLPFIIETPSQKRRQAEAEENLLEIEKAIATFSRPKVYVALDR